MRCVPTIAPRWPVVVGALLLLAATAMPARADKCISAKLKATGKLEAGLLACGAKQVAKGDPALFDPCATKALAKYATAFEKAGACAGAENDCVGSAFACLNAVAALLPDGGPSKCEAARWKAAGKRVAADLACYAKGDPAALPACRAKAEAKFEAAYNKVTGCTGDGQVQGAASTLDTVCVDNVVTLDGGGNVTALCPQTTTSTVAVTTTSTSSTTSTVAVTTTSTSSTTSTTLPPPSTCCTGGGVPSGYCVAAIEFICTSQLGGSLGGSGTVCGGSGACVVPPASPGNCCQLAEGGCISGPDPGGGNCATISGSTFFPSAVCGLLQCM